MNEASGNLEFAAVEAQWIGREEATDEALVGRVLNGDEAAFEAIFNRHRRRVARVAGRFFNQPERVEEIVQEVFTKVYFALDSYSAQRGSSFAAWLSRIAINACYDELRRVQRRAESELDELTGEEVSFLRSRLQGGRARSDAEAAIISRDLAAKLLERLGPDDRLVLTLLDAEELSVAEIAAHTGWSLSKVKVRAHRARAALRRVLGEFL